mmetsp:Transcript_28408/g.91692  ORF Transcript_28408/g.91692 Transcript_28408/m.91692 type:complete len:224 (-) Transcript_28408:93-764(-)
MRPVCGLPHGSHRPGDGSAAARRLRAVGLRRRDGARVGRGRIARVRVQRGARVRPGLARPDGRQRVGGRPGRRHLLTARHLAHRGGAAAGRGALGLRDRHAIDAAARAAHLLVLLARGRVCAGVGNRRGGGRGGQPGCGGGAFGAGCGARRAARREVGRRGTGAGRGRIVEPAGQSAGGAGPGQRGGSARAAGGGAHSAGGRHARHGRPATRARGHARESGGG